MASKRGWRRYRPPSERRDERGRPVGRSSPRAAGAAKPDRSPGPPDPGRPSKADRRRAARSAAAAKRSKGSLAGLLVGLGVVAVVVGIVVAAQSDDGDDTSQIDTELLNVEFVTRSLDRAVEEEGEKAVSLRLTEYGLTVEYFDPNARESRYFETNSYTEGYELRVEETRYEDYQPRPFDVSVLSPARIVAAVEDALGGVDDPYSFSLRVSADQESGAVSMVTSVSGDDSVDVTQAP